MKTKKEEKDRLNKLSATDKEELDTISGRVKEIQKKGIIDDEVLITLQTLITELMLKKEKYTSRLISLVKQGYKA